MSGAEPFLLAGAIGASLGGAAISAIGALQQGEAAESAAQFNATVARQDAQIVKQQTAAEIERTRREGLVRSGAAVAAAGRGGSVTGSTLDVLSSNIAQQELDVLNIGAEGVLKERQLLNTANLDISQGRAAKQASKLQAAGSILGGVSKAAQLGTQF